MKNSKQNISDDQLHQFVDGELSANQTRQLADCIANDELLRRKVEEYRVINRKIRQFYDAKTEAPTPARLLFAASDNQSKMPLWRVAATILWLSIGAVLGYLMNEQLSPDNFLRPLPVEAAFAHAVYVPEVRHPVEVDASEQKHLNAWLSKRLDRPITAPDLRQADYSLIGGRLLPDGHRAAAQFMYEDAHGQRITLFIRNASNQRETAFLHTESDALGIVYWIDNGLAYALTAAANRDELTRVADIVYREVNS